MPIVDLQRRLREIGRIRMGAQVATSKGGRRPVKLETFRLTSRDRLVISHAANVYGGEAQPWEAPDGQQWEVTTETAELAVIVPPSDMAFSQWYELWSAGGCLRRCDGSREVLTDGECLCNPAARECKTTTRLNVLLPDVPGVGVWRLESHGYYSAVELAGVVELCRQAAEAGRMLPARLRLEQRQIKRIGADGKSETYRFAVPVLDLDAGIRELVETTEPGWQPVPPELPEAPTSSVAEQLTTEPQPFPRRRNAAPAITPTGLEPRTASEVTDDDAELTPAQFLIRARRQAAAAGKEPPTTYEEAKADDDAAVIPMDRPMSQPTRRKLFALAAQAWPDLKDDARKAALLQMAAAYGQPGLTSRTQITQETGGHVIDALTTMINETEPF